MTLEQVDPPKDDASRIIEVKNTRDTEDVRNEFTLKLVEQSNSTAYNNLAKLIGLSEYTDDTGNTYRARKLTHKEIGQIRRLSKESEDIDQEKDWDKYVSNLKQQSTLLIRDFTEQDFDNADFYVLENLIVAWRMKPRGFRSL